MAERRAVVAGQSQYRVATIVNRSNGDPITSGTVYYYLYALTGANAGQWWDEALQAWSGNPVGNTCTHLRDGAWYVLIDGAAWTDGVEYIEVFEESTGLHIPYARRVVAYGELTKESIADQVWDEALSDHQQAGSMGAAQSGTDPATIADAVWDETAADHTAAGSMGEKQNQIVGAAAIADQVWDETLADHTAAGSTGAKLYALRVVDFAYTVNITLRENDAFGNPIQGAFVFLRDPNTGAIYNFAVTDVNGQTPSLTADAGTYEVVAMKPGTHTFNGNKGWPQTMTVAGDTTAEYYGEPMSGATPSGGNVCLVWGYVSDVGLNALDEVEITFDPQSVLESGDYIAVQPVVALSAPDGSFQVELIRKAGTTVTYSVTFKARNASGLVTTVTDTIQVPDQNTARYVDINAT